MLDTLEVYWIRFLNACGLDTFSAAELPGIIVVFLAFLAVIYAFYKAAHYSLWPDEPHNDRVKMSILEED